MCWLITFLISMFFFPLVIEGVYFATPHYKSAFLDCPGDVKVISSYAHYATEYFWDSHGKRRSNFNEFNSEDAFLYVEYTLNTHDSLYFEDGYTWVNEQFDGDSHGVTDFMCGWKHVLMDNLQGIFTSQLSVVIPTGKHRPTLRCGQFGVNIELLYSNSFQLKKHLGWTDLGIGYRYHLQNVAAHMHALGAWGINLNAYMQLVISSEFLYSLKNRKPSANTSHIILNPSTQQLRAQIEWRLQIFSWGLFTCGYSKHVWGRNVGTGGEFFGGTWFYF